MSGPLPPPHLPERRLGALGEFGICSSPRITKGRDGPECYVPSSPRAFRARAALDHVLKKWADGFSAVPTGSVTAAAWRGSRGPSTPSWAWHRDSTRWSPRPRKGSGRHSSSRSKLARRSRRLSGSPCGDATASRVAALNPAQPARLAWAELIPGPSRSCPPTLEVIMSP